MVFSRTDRLCSHSYPTGSIRESVMQNKDTNLNLRYVVEKEPQPELKLVAGTGKKVAGSKAKARSRLHLSYLFAVEKDAPDSAKNGSSKDV